MNEETRSTVKGRGVSVWLKAEFDILMERVRRRSHRPLLQDPDPEGVMHRLIDERYPVYAEADLTVMSRDVPHEAIVGAVVDALEDYVKANPS